MARKTQKHWYRLVGTLADGSTLEQDRRAASGPDAIRGFLFLAWDYELHVDTASVTIETRPDDWEPLGHYGPTAASWSIREHNA